jgi:hypothetical protein
VTNVFAGKRYIHHKLGDDKVKIGLNVFTGDTSEVNQNSLRQSMVKYLNSKGLIATLVSSSKEIEGGKFDYIIGVEIISSTASSKPAVTVTLYGKDGTSIIEQSRTGI